MKPGKKRGRPRKIVPVFDDPQAERQRVERCIQEGREPYPTVKLSRTPAEKELLRDVEPWVPMKLVVQANSTDVNGYPLFDPKVDAALAEARAKRKAAASRGGYARTRRNLAASIVTENADYFRSKWAEGASMGAAIHWVNAKRKKAGLECAGRSQMYEQLRVSGVWPQNRPLCYRSEK